MRFEYRARDQRGGLRMGILEADHQKAAIELLLYRDYCVVELRELGSAVKASQFALKYRSWHRVRTSDLVVFTRQLSAMMAAGLPIIGCLKIAQQQTANASLKAALHSITIDVESGWALWEAFGRHTQVFSGVFISMLRAGELGGVMDTVLERLSQHLEREQEISSKLKTASIYPLIVSVLAVLVVFFIITLVMPRLVGVFQSTGVALPWPTRVLLGVGAGLRSWGLLIVVGTVTLACIFKKMGTVPQGRIIYDRLYLHMPGLGRTIKRIAVARFARTLATLIRSGIPVLQALQVMEEIVGNVIIGQAISQARNSIKEGETISSPLQQTGLFEPMFINMMAVGEETGTLEDMLGHISTYYEKEMIHSLETLTALIEPVLILLVAVMVGAVIVAILLPMFELINIVGV